MQHLEGNGTPVLYIGPTVLKGENVVECGSIQNISGIFETLSRTLCFAAMHATKSVAMTAKIPRQSIGNKSLKMLPTIRIYDIKSRIRKKRKEKETDLSSQCSRFAYLCSLCPDADNDTKQTCMSTCCLCAIVHMLSVCNCPHVVCVQLSTCCLCAIVHMLPVCNCPKLASTQCL
jgi:hypothetical protein